MERQSAQIGPVCAPLGPSDEVLPCGLHDTTKKHARTHSLFLITREEKKMNTQCFSATAGRGLKEKRTWAQGFEPVRELHCPKTLHPLSTRTHKQNHNCEAKRNEQTSEKKNTHFLRGKEHRFVTLLENR